MQEEEVRNYVDHAGDLMQESLAHLERELVKVRTGKASPAMLGGLFVSYYGVNTPLNQVANVASADARTLIIQPWEKNMLSPIERVIFEANLGVTPQNDGEVIRLSIPPLTEERRKDLVKRAKALGEDAKVSVRNARRDAIDHIRKAVKNGYPEDAGKRREDDVQQLTDKYSQQVDHMIEVKEKDIMTI